MEVAEPDVQQLGRYRIERTLGAGGMGIVYLAQDSKLQRPVAIKKLRKDSTSSTAAQRIQSEAQLLAQLNHPNIVQLHDVLEEGDSIALVMEYVEGTTLQQWMREHTPSLQQKLDLLIQICNGLTEAHSLGIIHRDLKPDNILITNSGVAKITDFGIAKSLQQDVDSITREDQVAGTVDAMSPEQLQGYPLDPRSDLFSLGTITYELLCGAKPFEKGDGGTMALAHKVVSDPHIPPQLAWPKLPEPLAVLLDKLLGKLPEQRPDSAAQVAEALTLLQQLGADSESREFSATVTQLLRKPPNKRKRLFAALAGLAVLAIAGYWGWKEFTKLEPQYIAVLPVEINGEVRGEDNAKALTATIVRQALMNATSQLKASALVSFTPKEGQDFDAQLQALRNKGVTDALFARLECAQVRCEIELQRIGPVDSQIKQQTGFAFLVDKRQEAEYRIGNSTAALFPQSYAKDTAELKLMPDSDYSEYLNIVSRLESKGNTAEDLTKLKELTNTYPNNPNLYRIFTQVATDLFVLTNEQQYIQEGLDLVGKAKSRGIDKSLALEIELWLRTYSDDSNQFDELWTQLNKQKSPSAAMLAKYSRFLFSKGDYEAGQRYAEEAEALNPSADSLYLVALHQTASGNYDSARLTLNKLLENYSRHWSSYSLLGAIEGEVGNLSAAEKAFTSIPEALRSWRTQSNLGALYFLQQKYVEALKTYQQVLKKAPENIPAIGQIAETYLMLGESEKAKKEFLRVVELTENKEAPDMLRYRAIALANLGEVSMGIALAHALLKKSPDDTDVKYSAAQIYAIAGEWRSANYFLEQLLQQGMSADWFRLPAFRRLCARESTTVAVTTAVCK
ncbi:serine/threonine protein kinase [Microbulbifer donghaiensis]|uniref:Serine/threonine protein kinase n=1 Tax=Microbulbifer donghaiensis TaxID=494016 RepID=A0A1M4ZC23_9GAMM|nr:serine/threonine-protein kinase [Microbulbifer donghaiensis]SHF15525.1 serine/threonine protein kinase [Microbulbifer donghaiensis]